MWSEIIMKYSLFMSNSIDSRCKEHGKASIISKKGMYGMVKEVQAILKMIKSATAFNKSSKFAKLKRP